MPGRSPFAGCSDLVALGVALRELRERRGVQQEAVSYDAGLGKGYVSAAESGQINPSFLTLLAILRTLRASPSELVEIYARNIAEIDPQAGAEIPACPTPEALAHIAKLTAQTVAYDRLAKARRARSRMRTWT
jgi:transcriptional regulator with XRE-family HTH domain